MKILLLTPPFSEQERYGKLSAVGTLYPPLGLAYIAAVAEREGHEVRVIESEALGCSYGYIYDQISEMKPDLIGMPTFLNTIPRCFAIADEVKKRLPGTRIVLGGVQATIQPDDAIAKESVDFVVRGEGENVFRDLLRALEGKIPVKDVAGLVWKDGARPVFNKTQAIISDLDSLPTPARHLFPMKLYHSSSQLRGNNTIHMMTSRGCPYRCTYCTSHMTFGKTFRHHSAKRVIDEIIALQKDFNADSVQFYDESFTLNKKRINELCDEMLARRIKVPWACFTRVNLVDRPLLEKMNSAGCYQIFYGVEAATQRLLDIIKKDITVKQVQDAFRWTKEAGIETMASFMIGLPTETLKESYGTIDFAIELDADYAQWAKTTPFPGTELYDICKKHGRLLTDDWSKFTGFNEVVYVTDGRTKEDILKVEKEAFRRFYLRPSYIIKRLRMLLKLPPKKIFNLIISALTMSG